MMSHFAKLKGCIVGTQKEAFQKTPSTLLLHKLFKDLYIRCKFKPECRIFCFILCQRTLSPNRFIPPREYRWENYTLMGNYYSQYEDVAKVCNFENKRAAKPSINSFSKYKKTYKHLLIFAYCKTCYP